MHLQATSTSQLVPPPYQEDSMTVPKAFRDQLQKIRAEKMGRNNYFKTNDPKHDGNFNSSSMMQNEDGPSEAQPRRAGTAISNSERKSMRKGLGNGGRRRRGTADIWTQNPRENSRFNSKNNKKKVQDVEMLDEYAGGDPDNRSHKVGRFCNTMKVYQQFCSITGVKPHWSHDAETTSPSTAGEGADPCKSNAKLCLGFEKYSKRKGITKGEYSAHEERFRAPQPSALDLSEKTLQIRKYAG